MKTIDLTLGEIALVDNEDYDFLLQWNWRTWVDKSDPRGLLKYAIANAVRKGRCSTIRMHRVILEASPRQFVDHENGNGLDNQRTNLRIASNRQNQANMVSNRDSISGFKGVTWDAEAGKWRMQIKSGSIKRRGRFLTEVEAAKAYDVAALDLFGEFARLNFPV